MTRKKAEILHAFNFAHDAYDLISPSLESFAIVAIDFDGKLAAMTPWTASSTLSEMGWEKFQKDAGNLSRARDPPSQR